MMIFIIYTSFLRFLCVFFFFLMVLQPAIVDKNQFLVHIINLSFGQPYKMHMCHLWPYRIKYYTACNSRQQHIYFGYLHQATP